MDCDKEGSLGPKVATSSFGLWLRRDINLSSSSGQGFGSWKLMKGLSSWAVVLMSQHSLGGLTVSMLSCWLGWESIFQSFKLYFKKSLESTQSRRTPTKTCMKMDSLQSTSTITSTIRLIKGLFLVATTSLNKWLNGYSYWSSFPPIYLLLLLVLKCLTVVKL